MLEQKGVTLMTNIKQHLQPGREGKKLHLVLLCFGPQKTSAVTLTRQCRLSVKFLSHKMPHLKRKKSIALASYVILLY